MARSRLLLGVSVLWLPLSMLADGLSAVILPFLALDAGRLGTASASGSGTLVGLVTGAGLLLGAALQPLAGGRNDRSRHPARRQRLIVTGSLLTVAGLVLVGAAGQAVTAGAALLFAAAVAAGVLLVYAGLALAQAGLQALLPELVPRGMRGRAAGLKGAADLLGAFLGFAILAVLLGGGQLAMALVVLAGAMLGGVVLTAVLAPSGSRTSAPPRPSDAPGGAPTADFAGGRVGGVRGGRAEAVALDPRFLAVVVARFLFLLGTYAVGRFLLLLIAARMGLDAEGAAEATAGSLALLALATAGLALPAGWLVDRLGRLPVMAVGAVLGALGTLLLLPAATLEAIVAAGLVMAAGSASFMAGNWALAADLAPAGGAGRALGLANLGTAGAAAAAGLFGIVLDLGERSSPGLGYTLLLTLAAAATAASLVPLRLVAARSAPDPLSAAGPRAIDRFPAAPGGQP